eukprot:1022-Heterococcus_DN1.PRE.4
MKQKKNAFVLLFASAIAAEISCAAGCSDALALRERRTPSLNQLLLSSHAFTNGSKVFLRETRLHRASAMRSQRTSTGNTATATSSAASTRSSSASRQCMLSEYEVAYRAFSDASWPVRRVINVSDALSCAHLIVQTNINSGTSCHCSQLTICPCLTAVADKVIVASFERCMGKRLGRHWQQCLEENIDRALHQKALFELSGACDDLFVVVYDVLVTLKENTVTKGSTVVLKAALQQQCMDEQASSLLEVSIEYCCRNLLHVVAALIIAKRFAVYTCHSTLWLLQCMLKVNDWASDRDRAVPNLEWIDRLGEVIGMCIDAGTVMNMYVQHCIGQPLSISSTTATPTTATTTTAAATTTGTSSTRSTGKATSAATSAKRASSSLSSAPTAVLPVAASTTSTTRNSSSSSSSSNSRARTARASTSSGSANMASSSKAVASVVAPTPRPTTAPAHHARTQHKVRRLHLPLRDFKLPVPLCSVTH